MSDTWRDLKQTQRERLFFLEFLLYFTGVASRSDLCERFGISEPAATKDFALYGNLSPKSLQYDPRCKKYVLGSRRLYFKHDVDQTLFALVGERSITISSNHARRLAGDIATSIKRKVAIDLVGRITRAIHLQKRIHADYVSTSKGARVRALSPHALIHDGLRWHIRSFDHEEEEYRDYVLARFRKVHETDERGADPSSDEAWRRTVILELIPHPRSKHPEATEIDYEVQDGVLKVEVRECTVGYFLRRWPIDFTDNALADPRAYHLFLKNKTALLKSGVDPWALEPKHTLKKHR